MSDTTVKPIHCGVKDKELVLSPPNESLCYWMACVVRYGGDYMSFSQGWGYDWGGFIVAPSGRVLVGEPYVL